jgi:adenine deaminase
MGMSLHATPSFEIQGQIVDVHTGRIFPGLVRVTDGCIAAIEELPSAPTHFVMPGFVDAHVHIESSMLVPTEFARLAVLHGSVATVSDPHEIGNVLGLDGVKFMIENGRQCPFKFYFGAPSCVPATAFETAGATIDVAGVTELLAMPEVKYLAEMMNFPGVLHGDPEVMAKIAAAKAAGKPVDGHAPGLRGAEAARYFAAGISTDHECFTLAEGEDKAALGVHVLIREGSAAKNFEDLHPLISSAPDRVMFCSDDKHPDSLELHHINRLAARAVAHGHDLFAVLRAATLHPVRHYGLEVGLLRVGDPADFIVVEDLVDFKALATYIDGRCCMQDGRSLLPHLPSAHPNQFAARPIQAADLALYAQGAHVRVIGVDDGQLVTRAELHPASIQDGLLQSDPDRDLLKLVVLNRYTDAPPAIAFVQGFGLQHGAIAGSVAHDSHNIIAVGCSDADIATAINLVIEARGGISLAHGGETHVLPLPVAGLMTDADGFAVSAAYTRLDQLAKAMGARLAAPYMTLSFCALLVIPALKLSDLGLFDGARFCFTPLQPD